MNVQTRKDCPICSDTGWRPIEKDGLRAVEICDCRRQQRDRRLLERARIPRRYRLCDFESFEVLPVNVLPGSKESLFFALGKARRFVEDYPLPEKEKGKRRLISGAPGCGQDSPRGRHWRGTDERRASSVLRIRSTPFKLQEISRLTPTGG